MGQQTCNHSLKCTNLFILTSLTDPSEAVSRPLTSVFPSCVSPSGGSCPLETTSWGIPCKAFSVLLPVAASGGRSLSTSSKLRHSVSMVMSFSPDSCRPFSTIRYRTMPTLRFSRAIPSRDRPFEVEISVKLFDESRHRPLTRTDLMGQQLSSTSHLRSFRSPPNAAH